MDAHIFTSLPPLLLSSPSHLLEKLPELRPLFFIPPLENCPQDPVTEGISSSLVKREEGIVGTESDGLQQPRPQESEEIIWTEKRVVDPPRKNHNLSWDAFGGMSSKSPSTPFLSEQSKDVFEAVRHHVQPRMHNPSLQFRYIRAAELWDNLSINLVGNSSTLFIWDADIEQLVSCRTRDGLNTKIIVDGLDDVASNAIIERFLNIGTIIRRLESFMMVLGRQDSNPTVHAFSHALSTILVHIRDSLTKLPPYPTSHLTSLWLHFSDTEDTLTALAVMCHRSQSPPYDPFPDSSAGLLSHVFKCLEEHIEHGSSRHVIALLAYILTASSRDCFDRLGERLGLFQPSRAWLHTGIHSKGRDLPRNHEILPLDNPELDQTSVFSDDDSDEDLPSFVPPELAEAFPAAQKSLRLLRTANPDHPLCSNLLANICNWVWLAEDIETLWLAGPGSLKDMRDITQVSRTPGEITTTLTEGYGPEFQQFHTFDLEPGAHLATSNSSNTFSSSLSLPAFLASFPERLPPLVPKLQHLATLVLQPLFVRTTALSNSLLKLFLTSLHLETHLIILRSYMLVTFLPFRMRLVDALFSDTDEHRPIGRGTGAQMRSGLGGEDSRDVEVDLTRQGGGQGIGLIHGLVERNTWPPGGADLSFFLRSVIVDSLEERKYTHRGENADSVWAEGEACLGFALRDPPVSDGRERWLDPMSIEALDFLYLDYKPPHPLDVVVTPEILSKYQRVFTFLLRLFRVETVLRVVYRSMFKATPLFEQASDAQRIFVRLRFQIQTFITAFTAYVFDSVIGGNFDTYLQRIAELRNGFVTDKPVEHPDERIHDVFSLRDSHSELLDRILSGCLLKTRQRVAGDALKDLLDLSLRFGAMVINIQQKFTSRADGAEEISSLFLLFQKQMLFFIKTIEEMRAKEQITDKNGRSRPGQSHLEGTSYLSERHSQLNDLLTRIDPTHWWRRTLKESMQSTK